MTLFALLARRARGSLVAAILCGVLGGASNTVFLALVNDRMDGPATSSARLVAGFIAVAVVMLLSYVLSRVLLIGLLHRMVHDLRVRLSRQIMAAPLPRIETIGPARLLTILTEDISAITATLGLLPSICINAVILAGSFLYLAYLSPVLLLLLLGLLLLAVLSYTALDARASAALRDARDSMDDLGEGLDGLIRGNRELKLHRPRRQVFMDEHLQTHLATVRDRSIRGNTLYALATSWGQILTVLLIGIVLFVVPGFYAVEDSVLSGYALGVIQITGALGALLESLPAWRHAQISMDKVEQLGIDLGQDVAAPASAGPLARFERVDLAGVTYAFEREGDSAFTLGPIELSFHPGEIVFITGGNGSGKTTLAKLIAGLYTPTSGEIRLNSVPVGEDRRDDYRQLFTVSFTDGHVFRPLLGLDEQRVREYLEQFQLQPWVHVTDGAFSTTALSQGQRKRLLLATALVEERPFYIFDEWAANQDQPFRERFYRELLPALKARGKAVVVITHDDRYDHVADAVIRLDGGRIRQEPRANQEGGTTQSCLSS